MPLKNKTKKNNNSIKKQNVPLKKKKLMKNKNGQLLKWPNYSWITETSLCFVKLMSKL